MRSLRAVFISTTVYWRWYKLVRKGLSKIKNFYHDKRNVCYVNVQGVFFRLTLIIYSFS